MRESTAMEMPNGASVNDLPFDIFGQDERPQRERSQREKAKASEVSYRRYNNSGGAPCWDCVKGQDGVRTATIVRREGEHESYLCTRHAQTIRDEEALRRNDLENAERNKKASQRRRS